MKNLEHRNVLITGGSRGTGLHIARVLASEGAKVALTARSQTQLAGVAASLKETGGKRGVHYDAVYCATKAGLIEWSHALRLETADHGVGVTVICPGYVTGAGMFARFGMRQPLSMGYCTPEQVANAVVHAIHRSRPLTFWVRSLRGVSRATPRPTAVSRLKGIRRRAAFRNDANPSRGGKTPEACGPRTALKGCPAGPWLEPLIADNRTQD